MTPDEMLASVHHWIGLARTSIGLGLYDWALSDVRHAQAAVSFVLGAWPSHSDEATVLQEQIFIVEQEIGRAVRQTEATTTELVEALAATIGVLRTRDGIEAVTDELARERARNAVMYILATYRVTVRDEALNSHARNVEKVV